MAFGFPRGGLRLPFCEVTSDVPPNALNVVCRLAGPRGLFLVVVQRFEKVDRQSLRRRQDADVSLGAGLEVGWIGGVEVRRCGNDLRAHQREAERQMMPLDAPAPVAVRGRRAE